ncbi:TPA: hypothetical protein ACH3X1_011368 [Trebouxia sp. C0004]
MYSDRVAGEKASRPALDTSSRLFQHITDNQEDRRLYEEASVQLYDATPDANVAKRHGVLKAKINGKIPQPWMSMTRQVTGQASSAPGLAVAACHQSSYQLSLTRSASPEASSAADGIIPPHHHAQSAASIPYSEGLFARQRAAKRKSAPAAPPPYQHSGSTADRQLPKATKSFKTSNPDVEHHHQMTQAAQHALAALDRVNSRRGHTPSVATSVQPQQHIDALDRFNARKGYSQPAAAAACLSNAQNAANHSHTAAGGGAAAQSSIAQIQPGWSAQGQAPPRVSWRADQRPHAQLSRKEEAQRPLDALDLFNMRHRGPNWGAEACAHGAATDYQQPAQQAQMVEEASQPNLDGLDRFNARKGRSKATGAAASKIDVNPVGAYGKISDIRGDTANESQQSQTTSVQPEQVSCLPATTAAAMAESSMTTHIPDALDRVNCILLARRNSRKCVLKPRHRSSASPEATETSTHILTGAHMQVPDETASGSDHAGTIDHSRYGAAVLQARGQKSAVTHVFASGLRSAAAWQDGAQAAYGGSTQGLGTAGGRRPLRPNTNACVHLLVM